MSKSAPATGGRGQGHTCQHARGVFGCSIKYLPVPNNSSAPLRVRDLAKSRAPLFIYLARWANLPTGLYILIALISFFLIELSYLRNYWTDFHDLFTKWKVFV